MDPSDESGGSRLSRNPAFQAMVAKGLPASRKETHVHRGDDTTTNASIPDSTPDTNDTNEGASPMTNENNDNDTNDTNTTPQLPQHQLVHQSSGLPPTPPTMANSDIAEPQPERNASPAPMFADRVRNALQSHKSGLSTPVNNLDNHSPPTPEASPHHKADLAVPRPPLPHYPSSYADSFKTATEGLSTNGSTSRVHSPDDFSFPNISFSNMQLPQEKTLAERSKPVHDAEVGLGLAFGSQSEDASRSTSYQPPNKNRYTPRENTYTLPPDYEPESQRRAKLPIEPFPAFDSNLTEDSEAGEARKKNYPVSSPETNGDSEWLNSINPNVIRAALQPEPSPEATPESTPRKKKWASFKKDILDSNDTFSGNTKGDDATDDYDSTPAPQYLTEREKRFQQQAVDRRPTPAERMQMSPLYSPSFKQQEIRSGPTLAERAQMIPLSPQLIERLRRQEAMEASREASVRSQEQPAPVKQPTLREMLGYHDSEQTEDSERGEARVKHYQTESDSDRDRTRPNSSDGPPSPPWRKSLHHQAALHKLRKPIQPGDDVKRPDEALLYGNSVPWRKAVLRDQVLSEQSHEGVIENAETPDDEPEADPPGPELRMSSPSEAPADVSPPPTSAETPAPTSRPLREFTPSVPPADVESPPNTAARDSLVSNNRVYKAIQESNAKRHSVVSDGSAVQAMLVFPAEGQKRKLRHTPKRESLRANISTASLSKPNSEESMHTPKLRHKRGMDSIGSNEATGAPTPERFERRVHTEPSSMPSAKFAYPVVNGMSERPRKISAMPGAINGGIMKPHKLRRSLRDQALDRHSVCFDLSHEAEVPEQAPSSPRLRKFSREERLDKNREVRRTSLYAETATAELDTTSQPKSPELRRFSKDLHLENNQEVRRTSLGRESQLISFDMDLKLERLASDLTDAGRDMPDRSSIKDRRTSSDSKNPTSPRRKSFDPRLLNPIGTPLSTSLSERTAVTEAEYGLARGVEIHQHNNDSLLLIHGRSPSYDPDFALSSIEHDYDTQAGDQQPYFHALVESPSRDPVDDIIGISKHHVDSPLTNPREAPTPPVIQFIPPTPNEELERSLSNASAEQKKPGLQRGLSWSQKAKRFSENLVQPLPFGRNGSVRRPKRVVTAPEQRPRPHSLSPMWTPRPMFDHDSDSEDSYSDDDTQLPPGGDTSDINDHHASKKRNSFLPRNMSVRMPGFRGNGGFLVGNSLGLDRHGTNNRRHYVAKRPSRESMRREKQRRRRTFTLPFTGGKQIEYVGFSGLQEHLEKRAAEKRRQQLRESIGTRVFHGHDMKQ